MLAAYYGHLPQLRQHTAYQLSPDSSVNCLHETLSALHSEVHFEASCRQVRIQICFRRSR